MRPSALERKRRALEARIEEMITLLDILDGDVDLEPTLGAPESRDWRSQVRWVDGENAAVFDDAEDDGDDREPDDSGYGDAAGLVEGEQGEPSLGWTSDIDQEQALAPLSTWQLDEGEPLLGWPERGMQIGNLGRGDEGEEFSAAGQNGIWSKSKSQDDDDEDGGDTEPNGDELDLNGDEADYSGYADEFLGCLSDDFDGSGNRLAERMLKEGGGVYQPDVPVKALQQAHSALAGTEWLIPEIDPRGAVLRIVRQ